MISALGEHARGGDPPELRVEELNYATRRHYAALGTHCFVARTQRRRRARVDVDGAGGRQQASGEGAAPLRARRPRKLGGQRI
jgi:hypothetical protein